MDSDMHPDDFNEELRIQSLCALGLLDTPQEDRFDRITRLAAKAFAVPIALVTMVDGSRQWFKSKVGLEIDGTPRSQAFCSHAILQGGTLIVPDATRDPRFADNPLVTGDPGIRFYAGEPIYTPDGYAVGTICLIDRQARTLSAEEQSLLKDLANMVQEQLALYPIP